MRVCAAILAGALVFFSAARLLADEVPVPPPPSQWVTDNAGFISSATRDTLNRRLSNYDASTGHQVLVWIGSTTGDAPLENWTIRAFTAWRVGRKKLDDGAVLFVFVADRKVRIEVGYGLESVLTDAQSSQIIRNDIVPHVKAGDPDTAITDGVNDILAAVGGETNPTASSESPQKSSPSPFDFVIIVLVVIAIVILRRGWGGYFIGSGGWGMGWGGFGFSGGGGGGGFSGGGGMGGGGGASGGW